MGELTIGSEVGTSMRERINGWFDAHEVPWELFMAALAIVFVAIGFLADEAPAGTAGDIAAVELALTALFIVEFGVRFAAARSRVAYLRGHWIDVVAVAPPIRGARVLRLLRLLRLVRAFAGVYRAGLHLQRLARHRGFAWLLAVWLGVMVLCSAGLYIAEHDVNKFVDSPFDALWWGVTTLTTVGYGDVVPTTNEGRLAAMALMLLGIGLFSAITATITSFMMSHNAAEEARTDEPDTASQLERLAALHARGALTDDEFARAKQRVLRE